MVEHCIHDDFHSTFMSFLHQFPQILCRSKWRIDLIIIDDIVLMTWIWFEDRCHIQNIDSQILNVIQMFNNSSEITMQIIHRRNWCFIPLFLIYLLRCCKTGRKNLIHDLICCPVRHLKHFFFPKILRTIKHSVPVCDTFLRKLIIAIIYFFTLRVRKFKIISETYQMHLKLCFIIIMKLWSGNLLHQNSLPRILALHWYILIFTVKEDLLHIIFFNLHTYHKQILINCVTESFVHIMINCWIFHNNLHSYVWKILFFILFPLYLFFFLYFSLLFQIILTCQRSDVDGFLTIIYSNLSQVAGKATIHFAL